MNFAFIGRPEWYHTTNDNPEHLDRRSLQEQGRYALSLARRFGNLDLRERHSGDAIYFPTLLTSLVVYPLGWAAPIAWSSLAALLLLAGVAWRRRSRGRWIAISLLLPGLFQILVVRAAPGVSYVIAWPLLAAIASFALLVTAPKMFGLGWRAAALMALPGAVFLLLLPLLSTLIVALGARAAAPVVAAPDAAPRARFERGGLAAAAETSASGASPASAPTTPGSSSTAGFGPARAASYSAIVAKTGSPAEAASAREAGSPAITDSRRLLTSASRERSRKLIREVAIREPYGMTSATFVPAADRIRDAADVISSSTSR